MVRALGRLKTQVVFIAIMVGLVCLPGCSIIKERQEEQKLIKKIELQQAKKQLYIEAETFYQERKLEEAKQKFLELTKRHPTLTQAYYRLGNIAFLEKRLDDAGKAFEKVVSLDPKHSKAHYNLAMIRLLQSEKHFKFYTATLRPDADVSAISKFLGHIDEFSKALSGTRSSDELDTIASAIDKRN